MHDKILDYAKDKNCLLCVTPDRGGSVYSPLYTPSWRIFNGNPATWTAAQTAMTDIDVSQDYTLEVEFLYKDYNEAKQIFHYTNGYGLITIWQNASNYVVITTTLLKTDGSTTDYYLEQILPSHFNINKKNTVKVSVSGTSINIFVNGNNLISDTGKVRTNTTNVATYPMNTNIDYVYSINITNNTTGTIVWQASYEDVHAVYEPLNFTANNKTWSTFQTMQENADWTHDYTFQCTFKLNEKNVARQLFYYAAEYCMFGIYIYDQNSMGLFTNMLHATGASTTWKGTILAQNIIDKFWDDKHTVKIVVQGTAVYYYIDDELVVEHSNGNERTTKSNLTFSAPLSKTGYIYDCFVKDDTDNKVVWQATKAELNQQVVGGMSPNPTPINFADNSYAFYDCQAAVQEVLDQSHDFTFEIEFKCVKTNAVYIFASDGLKDFIRVFMSSGEIIVNTALLSTISGGSTQFSAGSDSTNRHVLTVKMIENTITALIDGEIVYTRENLVRNAIEISTPRSNAGYVYKISITDNTTGEIVWRYPSQAESVNLLYKYNMTTLDGFSPYNTALNSYVKTSLDLRNKVSNYTLFVDFEPAIFTDEANEQHQELAGQGGALIGAGYPPICSIAYYKDSSAYHHIQLAQQVNSTRAATNYKFINALTGRHKLVGTVKIDGTSNTELSIYLDGDKVSSTTVSGVPNGTADSNATNFNINGQSANYGWSNYPGKVYSCLLFDRLLTDGEIKELSHNPVTPLSWTGILDIVKKGKAPQYFKIGDVLSVSTPRWDIQWQVAGFDQIEPANSSLTHSMTLIAVKAITSLRYDSIDPDSPNTGIAKNGNNRWDYSSIRQWLNSIEIAGNWWQKAYAYDAEPDYATTQNAFMYDLPKDFLDAVAYAKVITALSNVFGVGFTTTYDKFFLPSVTEMTGNINNSLSEGELFTLYNGATALDRVKTNRDNNTVSYYLRSPLNSNPSYTYFIEQTGEALTSKIVNGRYIVPACIIA